MSLNEKNGFGTETDTWCKSGKEHLYGDTYRERQAKRDRINEIQALLAKDGEVK